LKKLNVLICILSIIGLLSLSLIALFRVKAPGDVKIRIMDDRVMVETPLLLINLTYYGARVTNWIVRDVGVGYTDFLKRYPLWS